jgi:hypothetical protein
MAFHLPDRRAELREVEAGLFADVLQAEAAYLSMRRHLPAEIDPRATEAYKALLVARRKWQFAYEKKQAMEGPRARTHQAVGGRLPE